MKSKNKLEFQKPKQANHVVFFQNQAVTWNRIRPTCRLMYLIFSVKELQHLFFRQAIKDETVDSLIDLTEGFIDVSTETLNKIVKSQSEVLTSQNDIDFDSLIDFGETRVKQSPKRHVQTVEKPIDVNTNVDETTREQKLVSTVKEEITIRGKSA